MNNDILESKAINILKGGYLPTDNKNLLTFGALTSTIFLVGMAAYSVGHTDGMSQMHMQMEIAHEYQEKKYFLSPDYLNSQEFLKLEDNIILNGYK